MTQKQFELFADQVSALGYWSGGIDQPWEGSFLLDAEVFTDMLRVMAEAPKGAREALIARWGE